MTDPTLLELVTYRMGAHTNSDDPTRYVPDDELADWRTRDPIERFATELRRSGSWDDERHEAAAAAVEERLERIIERALAREVDPTAALDHVVAHPSARSRAQRAEIAERSGTRGRTEPTTSASSSDGAGGEPADSEAGGLSWRA